VCPQLSPSQDKTYQWNGELDMTLSEAETHQQIVFTVVFE